MSTFVMPAKAGIQYRTQTAILASARIPQIPFLRFWAPAFAGVTGVPS